MGRKSGRRWLTLTSLVALWGFVPLATATPSAAGREKGTALPKAPTLVRTGHAAFWDCPSTTTELLVVVNTLTLHPGAKLNLSFTVRNGAETSCNYTAPDAGVDPRPTSTTLNAGPCGSVGFQVEDAHHHDVWPGDEVVNCPALGSAQLPAGGTVSGTGSWDQTEANSTHRVAPGSYTLVVENTHFSFPLRIAAS